MRFGETIRKMALRVNIPRLLEPNVLYKFYVGRHPTIPLEVTFSPRRIGLVVRMCDQLRGANT